MATAAATLVRSRTRRSAHSVLPGPAPRRVPKTSRPGRAAGPGDLPASVAPGAAGLGGWARGGLPRGGLPAGRAASTAAVAGRQELAVWNSRPVGKPRWPGTPPGRRQVCQRLRLPGPHSPQGSAPVVQVNSTGRAAGGRCPAMAVRRLSAASESVLMKTRHTVLPPQHTSKDPLIETEVSVTMCTVRT